MKQNNSARFYLRLYAPGYDLGAVGRCIERADSPADDVVIQALRGFGKIGRGHSEGRPEQFHAFAYDVEDALRGLVQFVLETLQVLEIHIKRMRVAVVANAVSFGVDSL